MENRRYSAEQMMNNTRKTGLVILAAATLAALCQVVGGQQLAAFMLYLCAAVLATSLPGLRSVAATIALCVTLQLILIGTTHEEPLRQIPFSAYAPVFIFIVLASVLGRALSRRYTMLNECILERDGEVMRLQLHNESLTKLANTDTLTGLPNRRRFFEDANREFARYQRQQVGFALMIIDIDHFKQVNDVYGHLEGDVVLEKISDLLREESRKVDLLGRLGGEEFAVILPINTASSAMEMANRLCEKCRKLSFDIPITLTISIGLTEVHSNDENFVDCMRRADRLLFQAKNNGRDRIEFG